MILTLCILCFLKRYPPMAGSTRGRAKHAITVHGQGEVRLTQHIPHGPHTYCTARACLLEYTATPCKCYSMKTFHSLTVLKWSYTQFPNQNSQTYSLLRFCAATPSNNSLPECGPRLLIDSYTTDLTGKHVCVGIPASTFCQHSHFVKHT
jgi:hypothetical protein